MFDFIERDVVGATVIELIMRVLLHLRPALSRVRATRICHAARASTLITLYPSPGRAR